MDVLRLYYFINVLEKADKRLLQMYAYNVGNFPTFLHSFLILSAGGFRKFLLIRIISLLIVLFAFQKWKEYIYPLNFNKNRIKEKSPPNQISIQRILCKLWVQKKPYKKILVKIEFKTLFCQAQETFFQGNNSYLSTLWILFLAEITPSK